MKFQFQLKENYSYGNYTSVETEWKTRYPKEDEIEKGVREGRIRIIFRIRKTSDNLNIVHMEVENQIKIDGGAPWLNDPLSGLVEKDIKRLYIELKQEFAERRLRG